ncbi:general substrate transporter [Xylariales sp. PMI_506]|nr:general substrate transporter [Xylariales sp. PMI_506]
MISTRVYNWYICLVAAMTMVLYGYDAAVFNAAQGSQNWLNWFNLDINRDSYLIGLVNTVYNIGAIIAGWFLGGPTADYFGRRAGIFIGCFLTIIATFMQTFAPWHNIGCFMGGRVIIGIGQGIALTSGPVYINEVAPPHIRGHIMTFWQLFFSVGSFIAYWVAYAAGLHRDTLGNWDWKLVVIFQMLMPLIICILIFLQPETPRWYIKRRNDIEKARQMLTRIRETPQEVEDELLAIREAIEFENEAISGNYTALFKDPSVRKRLLLAFGLNIGQQLTGQGTLNNYSSQIYGKVFTDKSTTNLINALNATFGIIFTLNAMWTSDRYGRKWLLMVGASGMAVCMLCVAVVGQVTPNDPTTGTKSHNVGIAIVFLFYLFAFFYKPSWGATVWMWTAEVFSVNIRAQAVGMCSQTQNVANVIFQQFFPIFLKNQGFKCLYFFLGINIILVAYVYFLLPETKQISIEEIDVLFGGQNHVEKGAQIMGVPDAHHAELGVNDVDSEVQQAPRPRDIEEAK